MIGYRIKLIKLNSKRRGERKSVIPDMLKGEPSKNIRIAPRRILSKATEKYGKRPAKSKACHRILWREGCQRIYKRIAIDVSIKIMVI